MAEEIDIGRDERHRQGAYQQAFMDSKIDFPQAN